MNAVTCPCQSHEVVGLNAIEKAHMAIAVQHEVNEWNKRTGKAKIVGSANQEWQSE